MERHSIQLSSLTRREKQQLYAKVMYGKKSESEVLSTLKAVGAIPLEMIRILTGKGVGRILAALTIFFGAYVADDGFHHQVDDALQKIGAVIQGGLDYENLNRTTVGVDGSCISGDVWNSDNPTGDIHHVQIANCP